MQNRLLKKVALSTAAATLALGLTSASAVDLDDIFQVSADATKVAQASQSRIDGIAEQASSLEQQHRQVLKQIEGLQVFNARQQAMIKDQLADVRKLERSIKDVTSIKREITPLMERMLETLERFVELDMPFFITERREALSDLRGLMDDADVAESEKFRLVLERYQSEMEYGRSIRAYEGELAGIGNVNFLQVGRVALVYQTKDRAKSGFYNKSSGQWEELGSEFTAGITDGINIAQDRVAPNLIRLPIQTGE